MNSYALQKTAKNHNSKQTRYILRLRRQSKQSNPYKRIGIRKIN
jgi:hypothetical protein